MIFPQVCNSKIIILVVFILNTMKLSANALGILSDVEEVERLVVDFSTAKGPMKKLMSYYTKSVCDFPAEMKVYLCQLYLKEDVQDFDYSWPSGLRNEALQCDFLKFSLRILDEKSLKSKTRFMYECPSTNEGEFLGERNLTYIARSRIENSALIFTRKNRSSPLYPHRYIDGFTSRQLSTEMANFPLKFANSILQGISLRMSWNYFPTQDPTSPSSPSSPLRIINDPSRVEGQAYQTAKWKQHGTYEKFSKLYQLTPICSLSNIQKFIFCKLVKNKTFVNDIDFELDENQPLRCEKRTISYKTKPMYDLGGFEKKAIPLVRCPVVVLAQEDDFYEKIRMIYSPRQVFIGNCSSPDCLLIFGKRSHTGETQPKIDSIHADFPITEILNESRSIDRKLPYLAHDLTRTPKSDPVTFLQYRVNRDGYQKLANYRPVYQLDQNLLRTEEEVLELFQIINLTSPYEKFRRTIHKYNICGRSQKEIIEFCSLTYGNQLFKYEINRNEHPDVKKQCKRLEVLLNDLDGKQRVSLIRCPIVELEPFEGLYLSGGVQQKTLILYSQTPRSVYGTIYPTTLAPQIPFEMYLPMPSIEDSD